MCDAEGRFIAEDKVDAVFVQQKGQGWGNDYPADKRNGDWEYARFEPLIPGTAPALVASQKYDGCFACHLSREARDFTFTFTVFVNDTKK